MRQFSVLVFNSEAMKTVYLLLLTQIFEVCAELKILTEGQSLRLSCTPQRGLGPLRGLHLYHHKPQTQTTLLSVSESGAVSVDPRLQLSGGLSSAGVNASFSRLQRSDSGLYVWELSYGERNGSDRIVLSENKTLLLVEGRCSSCRRYVYLLLTISAAAALLLLAFSWMIIDKCIKARRLPALQPHSPIYEEMSGKAQPTVSPQNNPETPSQPGEVNFPVYSNSNINQQPQDSYYASPRKLS